MRGIVIVPGDAGGALEPRELPEPVPAADELLVAVKALALNRADLYQRQRARGHAAEEIMGREFAGEVIGAGDRVTAFNPGDRVMAMATSSGAERLTIHHRLVIPVPDRLSWEEAASLPVAFLTAHDALVTNAGLRSGESVLVQAASSGVGVAAVQIAKLLGATPVIGTAGSAAKLATLQGLGMDAGINYHEVDLTDAVLKATEGRGVDIVVDNVGGPYLAATIKCMALRGRLISVGRLAGATADLDMDLLALRRLQLIGVTFRTRTFDERVELARRAAEDLLPALADGRLKAVVDKQFPLAQAAAAEAYMESNAHVGKIVLRV